jgi:hypothetical protein
VAWAIGKTANKAIGATVMGLPRCETAACTLRTTAKKAPEAFFRSDCSICPGAFVAPRRTPAAVGFTAPTRAPVAPPEAPPKSLFPLQTFAEVLVHAFIQALVNAFAEVLVNALAKDFVHALLLSVFSMQVIQIPPRRLWMRLRHSARLRQKSPFSLHSTELLLFQMTQICYFFQSCSRHFSSFTIKMS